MKRKILTYLIFAFLLPAVLLAQQPDSTHKTTKIAVKKDTSSANKSVAKSVAKKENKKLQGFVDKNANGVDDRLEKKGKHGMRRGKSDIFIDKDGDGICDGRESAIGLKKIMNRRHRGKGPMR